jgi:hypothetical protein
MNATKKLICFLTVGATLAVAAPAFADPGRDRDYDHYRDHQRYSHYDRHAYRAHDRDFERRHVVMVQRPIVVERPVYYEPAPATNNIGPAAIIGAAIGGYIDSRQ